MAQIVTFFVFSPDRYYVTFVPQDGVLSLAFLLTISGFSSWLPTTVAEHPPVHLEFRAAEMENKKITPKFFLGFQT